MTPERTNDPPLSPVAEKLLLAADELFYNEGVFEVGIDRVIERAGVAKASLYRNFGSKEQLVLAYLKHRHAMAMDALNKAVAKNSDPKDQIVAVFDEQANWIRRRVFRGCSFTRATAERTVGQEVHAATAAYRTAVRDLFLRLATEAELSEPNVVAMQLFTLYQGNLIVHEMPQPTRALRAVRRAVETLIADAAA